MKTLHKIYGAVIMLPWLAIVLLAALLVMVMQILANFRHYDFYYKIILPPGYPDSTEPAAEYIVRVLIAIAAPMQFFWDTIKVQVKEYNL